MGLMGHITLLLVVMLLELLPTLAQVKRISKVHPIGNFVTIGKFLKNAIFWTLTPQ